MLGKFIVLEGLDGAGTTTQTERLVKALRAQYPMVQGTCEPHFDDFGLHIRNCLAKGLQREYLPWYFAAARARHLAEAILPSLEIGAHVISDRYDMSSLAYQSLTHEMEYVWELNKHFRKPDLTVYLAVPVEACMARLEDRTQREIFEHRDVLERVEAGYRLAIAKYTLQGHRVITVNGTDDVDTVAANVRSAVSCLL